MNTISFKFRRYIASPEGKKRIKIIKEEMRAGYKEECDDSLFESAAFYRALTEFGRKHLIDGDTFKDKTDENEFWETQNNFEKKEQYYLDTIRDTMPKKTNQQYTLEDFIRGLED